MSIATEERAVRGALERVARLDDVVQALQKDHPDLVEPVQSVLTSTLEQTPPVRVSLAADLLGLDPKSVRFWIKEGVLVQAEGTKVVTITAESLYEVLRLVEDLRRAGRTQGLLDAVWYRLQDERDLADPMLLKSLEQMRAGQLTPVVIPDRYRHLAAQEDPTAHRGPEEQERS